MCFGLYRVLGGIKLWSVVVTVCLVLAGLFDLGKGERFDIH